MSDVQSFREPPPGAELNHAGAPRQVGVEIEFAAVSARDAASTVQGLFGGKIETIDRHRYAIHGSELGDFTCELDFQYAHVTASGDDDVSDFSQEFQKSFRAIIGDVSAILVPCEVVCPPVAISELSRIDELRDALRRIGAEGTQQGVLYAFGCQLNPDIVTTDADYLTAVLKAYILLSDWLRTEIQVDPTRWLLSFADPFPHAYGELLLSSDYWPDRNTLVENHLAYNPTRNRELDLLPLFCWLDEMHVRAAIDDPRIKPRPTFHYRLPNAQLQDPEWTMASEWNRWCRVEYLAADRDRLEEAASAWFRNRAEFLSLPWVEEVTQWLL
jgi:hypothetical protein